MHTQEFTLHMLNKLKAGSFIGTNVGFLQEVPFLSNARAMKLTVLS